MNGKVYKTAEGKNIVESFYKNILANYKELPFEQLYIPTEAGITHVLKFGNENNPPVILIHGTASNSASWLGCVKDFAKNYCVYCIDIPGEPGLSEPNRIKLASDLPNKWLSSLIEKLIAGKVSFVTISLGSWYALNFAVNNQENVTALSMLTTGGIVPVRRSFVFKALIYILMGKSGQKKLTKTIYHKTEVPSVVLEFQEIITKHFIPVMGKIPLFRDDELNRIKFPLQFFGGDCDALIDCVETGKRLKSIIPSAEINILEDTGHVIIDRFDEIKNFVDKCNNNG